MEFKIYFAASIRGGTENRVMVNEIIASLKRNGHTVLSEDLFLGLKEQISDEEIYLRDTKMIKESDLVIADLTTPSSGVGFEVAYALYKLRKPVIAVSRVGSNPSAMIVGCSDIEDHILFYEDAEWLIDYLEKIFQWHDLHQDWMQILNDCRYPYHYVCSKHQKQLEEAISILSASQDCLVELFGKNMRLEYEISGADLEYSNNICLTVNIWQDFDPEQALEKLDKLDEWLDDYSDTPFYTIMFNVRFNT